MAKKFVKVSGLHNVFPISNNKLNTSSLLPEVSSNADNNSTLYITADTTDATYGYRNGETYIWTQGELFDCNEEIISEHVTYIEEEEIRQLKNKKTNQQFIPVAHWQAILNKPGIESDGAINTLFDTYVENKKVIFGTGCASMDETTGILTVEGAVLGHKLIIS